MKLEKATREHTKFHNRRLIFKTIYDEGEISRVDIARRTHLTRTTVSSNVSELIDEGLVQEVGLGTSVGGKPPTLLSLIDDSRLIVAIDLAGNKLRGALVNLRGVVRHQIALPFEVRQGEGAIELVYQLIDTLVAATTSPLLGIGIGAPGIIDTPNGIVRQAVNLDWQNIPLRDLLHRRYHLPVYVANDSHVAAVAEHTFGSHKNSTNLLLVKAGRGIGIGIVINGHVFHGDDGGAGEIGHVVVVENGAPCRCGNFGCLETVASSRAIVEQARAIAQFEASSLLRPHLGDGISFDDVVAAHQAGDQLLQPVVSNAGRYLGIALAPLIGTLNIQHVVIGGSIARFGPGLLGPLIAQIRQRTLRALVEHIHVSPTKLGDDLVILGAAALLLAHELGLH